MVVREKVPSSAACANADELAFAGEPREQAKRLVPVEAERVADGGVRDRAGMAGEIEDPSLELGRRRGGWDPQARGDRISGSGAGASADEEVSFDEAREARSGGCLRGADERARAAVR